MRNALYKDREGLYWQMVYNLLSSLHIKANSYFLYVLLSLSFIEGADHSILDFCPLAL